jgi:NADPH:quinone reductase
MKAICVENPGAEYRLIVGEAPQPVPAPREVLIKVAAAGVNHADLAQALGRYPPPPGASDILGLEASGEIAAVGEGVREYRAGEMVCALLAGGGYAEFCTAPVECVLPLPKDVDVVSAAALPEVYFTIWTNLFEAARLKPGERILIHGGSSGIGTAAIQLCAARGHEVFTTAGTATKCEACERLGAAHAINYREEDFVEVVKQETGGQGVDVILDMVGGDYIQRNISTAATWGRIVNIAYQSGTTATVNFGPVLMKRLSLLATTLRSRTNAEKGALRDAVLREVWPLIETGKIKPVIDRVFPLADAQAAHQRMTKSEHIGKILLQAS